MKSDGSILVIGAMAALAAAGAAASRGSRSSSRDRISRRLAEIESLPRDPAEDVGAFLEFNSAIYGNSEESRRSIAETSARRLRQELSDPRGLGRDFNSLNDSERSYRRFLEDDLRLIEEEFGPGIGTTKLRSRAYRNRDDD